MIGEMEGCGQVVADDENPLVGILGAGRMGMPIIGHVAHAGFTPLVFDPDTTKKSAVTDRGGQFVEQRDEIARLCKVVMVCVGYEAELRALMLGGDGMLRQLAKGSIAAVLSTVSPACMKDLDASARGLGVHIVDAPVCRGGWAADSGTLLSLVGGDGEAFELFEPVARAYSSDVVWTGEVGSGQVAKAVNNLILWACLVADHEGLALAQAHGVDLDTLRRALAMSSASNHALDNWGKQSMAWAEDDMKIVEEMAVHAGISLPQTALNREICRMLKPRRYQVAQYGR